MDIEFSPGALGQRMSAAARKIDGPGFLQGGISGKRLCSIGHPAALREERAGRFLGKRTMGVLWRHSSVNLVESRSIALAATRILRRLPKINEAVSITESLPQPAQPPLDAAFAAKGEEFAAFLMRDNFALTIAHDT